MREKEDGNAIMPKGEAKDDAWTGMQRRSDDVRIAELSQRIAKVEAGLANNTTLTEAVKRNTDEIVEFFQAGKGFFTVVRSVGTMAKWIATIAAGLGIAYGIVKFGIGQILADMGIRK